MEGCPRNREIGPKLLDLIPQGRKWYQEDKNNTDQEKKLELRLGPPGGDEEDHSAIKKKNTEIRNIKKETEDKSFHCFNGNHFSPSNKTTSVPHISQKRTAPGPVVGWPPVRSFRKNLASTSSSKLGNESSHGGQINKSDDGEKQVETKKEGMFVKINMDGVPIGRKVDLNAYNSYEQLSFVVDKLFRGLLAAQRDISDGQGEEKPIIGLLDGKGEFTLTYEDNEGDKMLVGDVPWQMFVSSVKRLRVIKSSEISSALTFGCSKQEKMMH
ncbi:phytochrome-associated protein 1 [Arabidopsis thaliana]|jgi:auxin-responsive protein IAA|uniref:Auxin-responsive protein IAA26 n=13 Tax=Arabidopsis TaxID=3701 RepID=IAA26_ARATH|nr:phytochrome-associated protein 1 [Arabidopsis thaliana]Q8LAL2.2 RecName: Full=Auxin-responsive protein IAA26; AltName: Full=Indoleacetic acid-induced protein 26; AltName: Full=Phytochrome-associated protein 1 [Arabidopsis thaliana]KAG7631480.1 AUX/IAA domain [Arabidopsis suecica]AAG48758.2 auxin-induced protein AUX2-11 [Arabidopsis thaliana]AAG48765.1 putative phytochrome-associated protein 1 [Arabidopsis thaliana]AAK62393.1 phytochrome-associated protein 1 [Arabidopsis thaliana]AAL66917.1|eukprot:NP_188271.1 phytochrome-associated protein 1 [Arabidopsis thaliana]